MGKDWSDQISRYIELLSYKRLPETKEDDLFMYAYDYALRGHTLYDVHEGLKNDTELYFGGLYALFIGYCIGQKQYLTEKDEIKPSTNFNH